MRLCRGRRRRLADAELVHEILSPMPRSGLKVSGSFLFNGTVPTFERHGFTRQRQIGKHRWVVSRVIG